MIDQNKYAGYFEIVTRDKNSGTIRSEIIPNRIMDAALNAMADILDGVAPDIEIKYLAVGTGNTPVTDTDATLDTEIFRTQPTVDPARVSTGVIETTFMLLDSEAVGDLKEIGIFAGAAASATVDTGTLIARVLWTKTKSSAEEISIKRIDKVGRV